MRSPPGFSPRRPFARPGGVPRSGIEAAAALLRTEFERQRERRDIARLGHRLALARESLAAHDRRAALLCERILDADGEETP